MLRKVCWAAQAPTQHSTLNIQHFKKKMTNTKGTLKYRKIQRTPQTGENAGKKKWYATAVTDREMSFEDFVSHISDHGSPYSRGCIHGVLMDALDHLQELVLDGKSVRLGELGLFSMGMTSKAEDTRNDVTAQSIQGVHLILRNTRSWSNSELSKKCKLQEYGTYGTTEETVGDPNTPSQGGGGTTGDSTNGGSGTAGSDSKGDNPSGGSQTGTEGSDGGGTGEDNEL